MKLDKIYEIAKNGETESQRTEARNKIVEHYMPAAMTVAREINPQADEVDVFIMLADFIKAKNFISFQSEYKSCVKNGVKEIMRPKEDVLDKKDRLVYIFNGGSRKKQYDVDMIDDNASADGNMQHDKQLGKD